MSGNSRQPRDVFYSMLDDEWNDPEATRIAPLPAPERPTTEIPRRELDELVAACRPLAAHPRAVRR